MKERILQEAMMEIRQPTENNLYTMKVSESLLPILSNE